MFNKTDYVILDKATGLYARMLDTSRYVTWREYSIQSGGWCGGDASTCTHFAKLEQAKHYCNEIKHRLKRTDIVIVESTISAQLKEL